MRNRRSPLNPTEDTMANENHSMTEETRQIIERMPRPSDPALDHQIVRMSNGAYVLQTFVKATGIIVKSVVLRPGKGGEP
jgi:hypothetical protein